MCSRFSLFQRLRRHFRRSPHSRFLGLCSQLGTMYQPPCDYRTRAIQCGNEVKVLSIPKKGEYANETFFVTQNDAAEHLQFGVSTKEIKDVTGFAVFSDGLERLLYCHTTLAVAPAITGMLDWHKQTDEDTVSQALEKNLTEVFRAKTNDDCSLVLLTANRRDNGTMGTNPS